MSACFCTGACHRMGLAHCGIGASPRAFDRYLPIPLDAGTQLEIANLQVELLRAEIQQLRELIEERLPKEKA